MADISHLPGKRENRPYKVLELDLSDSLCQVKIPATAHLLDIKQAVNSVLDVLQMRVTKLRRIFQSRANHAVEAEMREPDQSVRRELWCRQNGGQK